MTAVYWPGGSVATNAESAEPAVNAKAPTELISAAVAKRNVAATEEVPATTEPDHPVLLAISVVFESYNPIEGWASAPETPNAVKAGPMPRIRSSAGWFPATTNPEITTFAFAPTEHRAEMFESTIGTLVLVS